jgi:hypothetical protein
MQIKHLILLTAMQILASGQGMAQDIMFTGTHPPDSGVIHLLHYYSKSFDDNATVAERDAKRKALVSPAYFYHGIDGAPIGLEGLTKRQTKNQFKLMKDSVYDNVLYQYENTAIYIFKEWQHLTDKGVEKEVTNSVLIVMGKENGEWKILSDIIGQKPKEAPATKIISENQN